MARSNYAAGGVVGMPQDQPENAVAGDPIDPSWGVPAGTGGDIATQVSAVGASTGAVGATPTIAAAAIPVLPRSQLVSGGSRVTSAGARTQLLAQGGEVGAMRRSPLIQDYMPPQAGLSPSGAAMNPQAPAYATGGVMGQPPNGASMGAPQAPTPPMDSGMVDSHITDMLRNNPGVQQHIQQALQQAIAQGHLDPHLANVAVQLAQACLHNPALWPQLRQFAITRGLCGPNDLPQQYDQGLLIVILTAAKAAQGMGQPGQQPQGQAQGQPQPGQGAPQQAGQPQGSFAQGGLLQGPGTGTSDSIQAVNTSTGAPVKVSNGEFVIPKHVVDAKGAEFFQGLIRKYSPTPGWGGQA